MKILLSLSFFVFLASFSGCRTDVERFLSPEDTEGDGASSVLSNQGEASSGEPTTSSSIITDSSGNDDGTDTTTVNQTKPLIAENLYTSYENLSIHGSPFNWNKQLYYSGPEDHDSLSLIQGSTVSEELSPELVAATVFVYIDGFMCTGTLIGPKTVVTAAHCIAENGVNKFSGSSTAQVGFGPSKSTLEYRNITAAAVHPDYDYSSSFIPWSAAGDCVDVAVLTLESDHPDGYYPISIVPTDIEAFEFGDALLAGWGDTGSGFPSELQAGETVFALSSENDGSIYYGDNYSTYIYSGDSGGPIYYVYHDLIYLLGVNSSTVEFEDGFISDFGCEINHISAWFDSL